MTTKINGNQIQLGDDADTSKNFIISVPATPDGTLSISRMSGESVVDIDGNGKVTFPSGSNELGVDQTWQDVTASRAVGTPYINNTGRPIMVRARGLTSASAYFILTVNGVELRSDSAPSGSGIHVEGVVPADATYTLSTNAGTIGSLYWLELR